FLVEERFAEIAGHHMAEPDEELRDDRLIEPELLPDVDDVLRGRRVAGDDRRRIAGGQPQHHEDEDRDDGHHRNRREQASSDEGEHGLRACAAPGSGARARNAAYAPDLVMFQNTGTGATMIPSMFLRTADG